MAEGCDKVAAAAAATGVVVVGSGCAGATSASWPDLNGAVDVVDVVLGTASVDETGLIYSAVVAGRAG